MPAKRPLEVELVPYARDNYAYLLHPRAEASEASTPAIVVDPGDADAILDALARHRLAPTALFCTHHHLDHVGGVTRLLAALGPLPVLGSRHDLEARRIPAQTRGLEDEETIDVFGHAFRALLVPGHTRGALAYVGAGLAFTGDTLFLGGCGRVFEGTMAELHASLARLAALAPETLVYAGHEYTEANLRFARGAEPDEPTLAARLEAVRAAREAGRSTMPGRIAEERATNPFLRCAAPAVRRFASERAGHAIEDEREVFRVVREAKDAL